MSVPNSVNMNVSHFLMRHKLSVLDSPRGSRVRGTIRTGSPGKGCGAVGGKDSEQREDRGTDHAWPILTMASFITAPSCGVHVTGKSYWD